MAKILVADADPGIAAVLANNLSSARHQIVTVAGGFEALTRARDERPDLILLEVDLRGLDGFEVCKRLKRDPATEWIPIVFVSGRADEIDRVLALELGADDYVTKPFSVREFLLRLKRPLMRVRDVAPAASHPDRLVLRDLEIDVPRYRVTAGGHVVNLTPTEFDLLRTLASNSNRVFTRDRLLQMVWPQLGPGKSRTVDTHIRRLRAKLGQSARLVDTVRGVGYRFVED